MSTTTDSLTCEEDAEQAIEDVSSEATTIDEGCPKCGSLTEWNGSSWCPDCGHYPGVTDRYGDPTTEETVEVEAVEPEKPAPLIPVWGQLTMGGFALVVLVSCVASNVFYYYGGDRGMWALIQLAVGTLLFCGAQSLATLHAMKKDAQLSMISGLTCPIDIWRHTFDSLPEGGRRVACAVWGITMAVCAVTVIGGLDYESLFEVEKKEKEEKTIIKRAMTAAAAAADTGEEGNPEDLDEAMQSFTEEIIGDDMALGDGLPSNDQPLDCVIYGYMQDGKRDFGRVLLAAMIRGRYEHVGEMDASDLPLRLRARLGRTLKTIEASAPICDSPFRGTWVNPTQNLQLDFKGWSVSGKMVEPKLHVETSN